MKRIFQSCVPGAATKVSQSTTTQVIGSSLSTSTTSAIDNALSNDEFRSFSLLEKRQLTSNTFFLRFDLQGKKFGTSVSSCVGLQASINGENVMRPYTPISSPNDVGFVDFVIKEYPAPGGIMSRHLCRLKEGENVEMKGPWKKLQYSANMKKHIGFLAGGTGLTPCYQVIKEILDNKDTDTTKVSLVYANNTIEDIIMKEELDKLSAEHADFDVNYVVMEGAEGWKGYTGYLDKEVIKRHMPPPSSTSLVYVCGPDPMLNAICGVKNPDKSQGALEGILKEMEYDEDNVYKF